MAYLEGTAEWLERVSKLPTKKEKIEALRKGYNDTRGVLINWCFNPSVKWRIPEGEPPKGPELYSPAHKNEDLQGVLLSNMHKFRIFIDCNFYENLRPIKRERLYIDFLNSLDPDDAELVIGIRNRKLPYKGLTRKLFEEAFPGMAEAWRKAEKNG